MHVEQVPASYWGSPDFVSLLRQRARQQPADTAFTYLTDGESEQIDLTYGDLDRQARAIAATLAAMRSQGQRALLFYPVGLDFVAALFGCLYAGVIAVPLAPPVRSRHLARLSAIASDADAEIALTSSHLLPRIRRMLSEAPSMARLRWIATDGVQVEGGQSYVPGFVQPDDAAVLQYTSGSTASPRGVVLTHRNLVHNSSLIAYGFEHTRSRLGVFWLPNFHDMGLVGGVLQPVYVGARNILMSPMAFLQKPLRWLQAITRFRATTSGGPNFAYDLCVRRVTDRQKQSLDLSTWDLAFNGAEPVDAGTIQRFVQAFAPCGFRPEAFYPCYGLAEATLLVTGGRKWDTPVVRRFDRNAMQDNRVVPAATATGVALVGCGRSLPDQEVIIVDPQNHRKLPADHVGEIWVRGPSVAPRYWRRPAESDHVFGARAAGVAGAPFLRTGDLGFLNQGELFVTGRLRDMIIVRGQNHYPQDLERTVQDAHPALHPDAGAAFRLMRGDTEGVVVVHEIDRQTVSLELVVQAIRARVLSEHGIALHGVALVRTGSIPRTSSGKIQRHRCSELFARAGLDELFRWEESGVPASLPVPPGSASAPGAGSGPTSEPEADASLSTEAAPPASPTRDIGMAGLQATHAGTDEDGRGGTASIADAVLHHARRKSRATGAAVTLLTPIDELGLDSLERMELLALAEREAGVRISPPQPGQLHTLGDMVEALRQALVSTHRPGELPWPESAQLNRRLAQFQSAGVSNPFFRVCEHREGSIAWIDGRQVIDFASYDYLGLAVDPAVGAAARNAIDCDGTSVSASRLVGGERAVHRALERTIAGFLGVEDAITFIGGHATNETTIGHLLKPGDLVYFDELAHNSIIQGAALSGASRRAFPHNDLVELDRRLSEEASRARRVMIAVEGVYSMDGDHPDLPALIRIRQRHHAVLLVDEAHSLGTMGATGRGIGEHFGIARQDVDLWMGTLSKALGSCGGYIAGRRDVVTYLRHSAPGFVYSVGMPPATAAAALAAIQILEREPDRVAGLTDRARLFRSLLRRQGLDVGPSLDSPIVPVVLGESPYCLRVAQALFDRGIHVQPIIHPAVPEGAARLRFFIRLHHREEDLRVAAAALAQEMGAPSRPATVAAPDGAGRAADYTI